MTTLHEETSSRRHRSRTDWRDLLRTVLKENPTDSEAVHKQTFMTYIQQEDYREYQENLNMRMLQLQYNEVRRSVFPPDREALKKDAKKAREDRRTRERETEAAVKASKERLSAKLYNFVRNKTFRECAQIGGYLIKVSKLGKPNERVGDILSATAFSKVMK